MHGGGTMVRYKATKALNKGLHKLNEHNKNKIKLLKFQY